MKHHCIQSMAVESRKKGFHSEVFFMGREGASPAPSQVGISIHPPSPAAPLFTRLIALLMHKPPHLTDRGPSHEEQTHEHELLLSV